ncbi:MAG: hypothetical protein IPG99_10255 [Ignavibacteria bacterium]|nr:hypothetical protein [Ignavibacteria bacterium]
MRSNRQGHIRLSLTGSGLSSGVYFYKLVTEGFTDEEDDAFEVKLRIEN